MAVQYMGSKQRILGNILGIIPDDVTSILDMCSGSGQVSRFLSRNTYKVDSNDILNFCNVLASAYLNSTQPQVDKLESIIEPINSNKINLLEYRDHWIVENFSRKAKFLYPDIAMKCAYLIETINKNPDIFDIGMTCLLEAISIRLNSMGHQTSYRSSFTSNALLPIKFEAVDVHLKDYKSDLFNRDILANSLPTEGYDLSYVDPPYNSRRYDLYYHLYETIVLQDTSGFTHKVGYTNRHKGSVASTLNNKIYAKEALDNVIANNKSKYLLLSYADIGIVSKYDILHAMKNYGVVTGQTIPLIYMGKKQVNEYLFLLERF